MLNKYRKVLLCFIIIIIVIIIVDLVFNFRGIFLENYKRYTESNKVETFDGTTVSIGGNQGVTISTPNSNSNQNLTKVQRINQRNKNYNFHHIQLTQKHQIVYLLLHLEMLKYNHECYLILKDPLLKTPNLLSFLNLDLDHL